MWRSILSVVKNIDIASFLCEETCRHCGQSVPPRAEHKRHDPGSSNERTEPKLPVSQERHEMEPRISFMDPGSAGFQPAFKTPQDSGEIEREAKKVSTTGDGIHMSLVSETSASRFDLVPLKQRPAATCLCPNCSELMWRSRQSLWSLPIVGREQSDEFANGTGTTSGAVQLLSVATGGMYEGPMQKLIRRLKYDDDRLVVRDLGSILTRAYEMLLTARPELFDDKDDIFLLPVPLHPSRKRKRGYNQAELIAREFAKLNHMRVETDVLIRKRKTRPQYGLGRRDRLRNIEDAFGFKGHDIRNKTVIIVDDVFTSGATLTACAALLTECGAKQVAAMAAARAPYDKKVRQASTSHK